MPYAITTTMLLDESFTRPPPLLLLALNITRESTSTLVHIKIFIRYFLNWKEIYFEQEQQGHIVEKEKIEHKMKLKRRSRKALLNAIRKQSLTKTPEKQNGVGSFKVSPRRIEATTSYMWVTTPNQPHYIDYPN